MKEQELRQLIREEAKNLLSELGKYAPDREFVEEVVQQLRRDYPFFGPYEMEKKGKSYRIILYADNGSGGREMHFINIGDYGDSDDLNLTLRNSSSLAVEAVENIDPINVPKVIKRMLLP